METRLVGCLLLTFLVAYGKSEDIAKITKIQKTTTPYTGSRDVVDNTLICCDTIPNDAKIITLTYIKIEREVQKDFEALGILEDKICIQFDESLSSTFTGLATFVLNFETSARESLGLAQATLDVPDIAKVQADLVGDGGEIIRVSGLSTSPDLWTTTDSKDKQLSCEVPSSDETLCFVLDAASYDTTGALTTCATVPNTYYTLAEEMVDVCNEGKAVNPVSPKGPEASAATLYYSEKKIVITISSPDTTTSYDVVSSYDETIIIDPGHTSGSPLTVSLTGYTPDVRNISVLVVGLNDTSAVVESNSANFKDYNLAVTAFGSTIEMEWKNTGTINGFLATLILGTSTSFSETEVDCNGLNNCYAYFINVETALKNRVQIQPNTNPTKNALNVIVSGDVAVSTSPTLDNSKDLRIQNINLDWSSDSLTVDVEVCFHHEDAADLARYQLVLVDSQGHWLRVQGTSQKSDGILCFSGATLDARQFTTANKVAVLVTKRAVDGRTVLASAESHIFFITPKVAEGVSGRGSFVSWRNPGGYTFTAKRAGRPAQISTTDDGSRYYFHRRTTRPTDMLVVEAVAPDVKMSAVVPLTHRETAGM